MRCLHIINALETGGAELALTKLLSRMDRSRFPSAVIVLMDEGVLGREISGMGIPVFPLEMQRGRLTIEGAQRLVRIAREFQPHVIQGWMYHGNLAAWYVWVRLKDKPRLYWNIRHTIYDLSREKRLTRWIIRLGVPLSGAPNAIIYNSEISARQHEALGYSAASRLLIPNGFETNRYKPDPVARRTFRDNHGIRETDWLIGMFARYHPMKDHRTFVDAAVRMKAILPEARFLLIGPGIADETTPLYRQIRAAGMMDRFILMDNTANLQEIYPALDIFTLSSSWGDAFPNVIGEAMSCEVPCVATDVGDVSMMLGETGCVVPPEDPDALMRAWLSILNSTGEARAAQGMAHRQRVLERFELSRIVALYEGVYSRSGP